MHSLYRVMSSGLCRFNRSMAILSALLILAATVVLTYEVITRYFLQMANDWVIELCIFMLIAATFLAAGYTQAERGHVGIDVLDEALSPAWNRVRRLMGDALSLVVVGFIARNAWHFAVEAYTGGWATSSTWAPALWIPYALMAFGLTTLGLQMAVQIIDGLLRPAARQAGATPHASALPADMQTREERHGNV